MDIAVAGRCGNATTHHSQRRSMALPYIDLGVAHAVHWEMAVNTPGVLGKDRFSNSKCEVEPMIDECAVPHPDEVLTELRYLATSCYIDPEEGLDVRLQVYPDGSWSIHAGDPSYDVDHRGYWGYGTITDVDTEADLSELALDLVEQAQDAMAA
jgi:hypothetical protein